MNDIQLATSAPGPSGAALGPNVLLDVRDVAKTFTLHLRGGQRIPVVQHLSLTVSRGECVVLAGASGAGKSTVLKMAYGNYSVDSGSILLRHDAAIIDLASAPERQILEARRRTVGYVSQFLRALPRVSTRSIVAEPLIAAGVAASDADARATALLQRLNIHERSWDLPPATFSGGEQQRVNIARGLMLERPLLLLDEPTASLDSDNRDIVIEVVRECIADGAGVLAIFHDAPVRDALATRLIDVSEFALSGREA